MISAPSATTAQVLEVLEFHAVVQRIPQAAQCHGHESDEGLGIIRGDFHGIFSRQQQCRAALQLACLHFIAHCLAHRLSLQDLQHHGAPVRQVRTDARRPLCAQHHAQRTEDPPYAARLAEALFHDIAQPYGLAEVHQGISAVEYHAQEFLEAPDQDPVFGEQQAPPAHFFMRCAAPENSHRHEIDVELRVSGGGGNQLLQVARRARRIAGAEQAWAPDHFEISALGALRSHHQAPRGPRQIVLRTDAVEHGEIGLALPFQDVAYRPGPGGDRSDGGVRLDGHAHPQA